MFNLYSAFVLTSIFSSLVFYSMSVKVGRFTALKSLFSRHLRRLIESKVAKVALATLFVGLCFSNVLGNVPGNYTPTQYYRVVLSVRISF